MRMSDELGTMLNELATAGARVVETREAWEAADKRRKGESLDEHETRCALAEVALLNAQAHREQLASKVQRQAFAEDIRGILGVSPGDLHDSPVSG